MKTATQIMAENEAQIRHINELLSEEYCFRCNRRSEFCKCGIFANHFPGAKVERVNEGEGE